MNGRKRNVQLVLAALALTVSVAGVVSSAKAEGIGAQNEISISGGAQVLNQNDTALPDHFVNVPAVATLTHNLNSRLAVEGEFTWMIPVQQNVEISPGVTQDVKNPDVLAYQANVRASFPAANLTPYIVAGAGAATFLSTTDADRVPQLENSQTVFAANFGAGLLYNLAEHWAVRADGREFVAFPQDGTAGLSSADGTADPIWMERGTLGLTYRF